MRPTFTVDLPARRVTHASGVAFKFREYLSEADWHRADSVLIEHEHLHRGPLLIEELAAEAKRAAIAAGMRHN